MQSRKQQLNPELLNSLKDLDDGRFFGDLIGIFLEHAPKLIRSLESTVRAQDSDAIRSAAHKLKGSCANIGAETLAELASFLESNFSKLSLEDSLAIVQRIYREFEDVRQTLEFAVKIHNQNAPFNKPNNNQTTI